MKKIIGLVIMSLLILIPLNVHATVNVVRNSDGTIPGCSTQGDIITCTIVITDDIGEESITAKLTEKGGAKIIDVTEVNDSDWSIENKNESNGVWTINLVSPGVTGEVDLFTFSYKHSGTEDCGVSLAVNGKTVATPQPETEKKSCKVTEDKDGKKTYYDKDLNVITEEKYNEICETKPDTGSTLPYIALGTIAVLAVGAYLATRNKAKMYKI